MRTITASESDQNGPQGPIRTCIGCRQRASAAELLRVVVAPGTDGEAPALPLVPDPRRRAPGRGAWVHPVLACVELAQRRRAFARALRVTRAIDASPVLEFVSGTTGTTVHPDGQR
ncbi:MAG TPA: YlxR family protein [Jatrophihabitantaceae bacterium]|nr:YlxR family protein [Jatrophihabitantaceae bacterium]